MLKSTLLNIARVTSAQMLRGNAQLEISGHFTDTRTPVANSLFIALRGENFNGNTFAAKAATCGAVAVLIDDISVLESIPKSVGVLLVSNTREAYLALAAEHRQALNKTLFFGITGSVGKSTTKEMLAHVLAQSAGWNVHKAKGSFNNEVGLSHTILHTTS